MIDRSLKLVQQISALEFAGGKVPDFCVCICLTKATLLTDYGTLWGMLIINEIFYTFLVLSDELSLAYGTIPIHCVRPSASFGCGALDESLKYYPAMKGRAHLCLGA